MAGSPNSPCASSRSSDHSAIASSVIRMMRTWFGGTARPTHVPAPCSVAARVDCNSRPSITATGRHSVAPYGVHNCASSGSKLRIFVTTSGGTGAPADVTRRIVGSFAPKRASTSTSAGDPNNWVTPKRAIASCSFFGSACAGRVGSMSGMIEVRPIAGSNNANGGKVGKSTPPGSMPKASRNIAICATKCRCR